MKKFINFILHQAEYGTDQRLVAACLVAIIFTNVSVVGIAVLVLLQYPAIVIPSAASLLIGYIFYEYRKQK